MYCRFYIIFLIIVSFSACKGQSKSDSMLLKIDRYIAIINEFEANGGNDLDLRKEIELFTEIELPTFLITFKNIICDNEHVKNELYLDKFLELLVESKNSAYEGVNYTLVDICDCNPNIIQRIENEENLNFLLNVIQLYTPPK